MTRGALVTLFLLLSALATTLSGCTTNPATGGQTFTGLMTTDEEIRIGRVQHPKVIRSFGGTYGGPALAKYVASIGQLLARTAERHDITYRFTVLNSDIVNAFAMPGGYIYVSRGLLALASNEAELAAVLAHEIGHLTALHHAQRQGRDLLAQVLVTGLGVAVGRAAADVGGLLAGGALRAFSREQEYQSDDLGLRYMARAGYQPGAMADFLRKLRAEGRLQAKRRGESPDRIDRFNYLATHPAPRERVARAEARAKLVRVRDAMTAEDIYLAKIDGMLYGDDPEQGFIRGRVFAHAKLRFRFEVPPGFRLFNSEKAVIALGPNGARIIFDQAPKPADGPMPYYLSRVWGRGLGVVAVEGITINGLEAATGSARIQTRDGPRDARLVAIRLDLQRIYRFVFLTPPADTARHAVGLRRTTYSFRLLDDPEAAQLKPLRIRVLRTRAGDTVKRLADRMAFAEFRTEWFRVLNGLPANHRLATGRAVKIVTE